MTKLHKGRPSSYGAKGKKPRKYSPAYQLWKEEAKKNGAGTERARALACAHAKQFGYTQEGCETG